MHLLIPFAAPLSPAGRHALQTLRLPHLESLLRRLVVGEREDGDEWSLSPPHERALARELGLAGADGELPWAAWHAARAGLDTADLAWGELTPVHWAVGTDQVSLHDTAQLALGEDESRALFDAVQPLFAAEGFALVWQAPLVWLAAHESLRGLPTASLDRVIGRNVERWLPQGPASRLVRRLQMEVQMLLYTHPVNALREARGALTVNSFWLSGCGGAQAARPADVEVDDRLRSPALAEDWAAWCDAWQALDATLAKRAPTTLTLCGERGWLRLQAPRDLWSRLKASWQAASPAVLLEAL